MQRLFVRIYGIVIALLAIAGLFVMDGQLLLGFMNADMALDVTRVVLAAGLLAVGFLSRDALLLRASLAIVGVLYIGVGLLGLIDNTVWGLLPTGLTGFDLGFHLLTGLLAAGIAFAPSDNEVAKRR